ncbi:hypothetical protein niasHS_003350 [Heterodera schachtii]|uniref:G-protein coupled receptors family 1 profile domain-containing protein n=1 Tax=Heterodera schachtii TaxID=97005 RepID=A0ABD2KGA6_HETSC
MDLDGIELAGTDPPIGSPASSSLFATSAELFEYSETPSLFGTFALFLLPSLLCAFGFVGNLLVLISIGIERRLQNSTNYFLFSLALADLLVCAVVMPFSILVELGNGVLPWTFRWGFFSCLVYTYADVFLCSCSIVHMTVISFDRYLGVSQPLKRHNKRKRIVLMKIFVAWVLSTIISSPLAILSFVEQQNILMENRCGIRSRFFMLYGSVFSFLIPLAIMAITTSRTAHLLQRQALLLGSGNSFGGLRRIMAPQRKMGGQAPMMFIANFSGGFANSSTGRSSNTTTTTNSSGSRSRPLPQPTNCHSHRLSLCAASPLRRMQSQSAANSPATISRMGEKQCAIVQQQRSDLNSPIIKILPVATDEKMRKEGNFSSKNNDAFRHFVSKSSSNECDEFLQNKNQQKIQRKSSLFGSSLWSKSLLRKSTESIGGDSSQTANARQRRRRRVRRGRAKRTAELASEQKATRVLIVVFSSFFICWTPFFVLNIVVGLCGLQQCVFPSWASLCALWFGYCSSTVNPIIYTIFNKRFREMFLRILKCHFCALSPFRRGANPPTGNAFWPTWTDANLYNSSCAHQSRTDDKGIIGTANRVTAQRRRSYAAGMPIHRGTCQPVTNSSTKFRRSTLSVQKTAFGISVDGIKHQFVLSHPPSIAEGGTKPLFRLNGAANRMRKLSAEDNSNGQSQETSKLYTISDSEEKDELNVNSSSLEESNGEEEKPGPRKKSSARTAKEGVALIAMNCVTFGHTLRKMSSQRIARSLSNVHLKQQPKNDCRVRRDGTARHSLLTVPGVGAIASDESAMGQQNATALWEGDGVAKSKTKKNSVGTNGTSGGTQTIKKWENTKKRGKSIGSEVNSKENGQCSNAETERFFTRQIHEISAKTAKI